MGLSSETYHKLSKALKKDVIQYIQADHRYPDFMISVISDAIKETLGEVDSMVLGELTFCIMDDINLV